MKMGVERVLKKKFGDELKEIYQVDQQNIHATIVVRTPKAFHFCGFSKQTINLSETIAHLMLYVCGCCNNKIYLQCCDTIVCVVVY